MFEALSSDAQKHLRVQWIKDMGQLLHVEKTSCCKPQPQTTLQKKTALYILSLQAYYDSTTIHFSVIPLLSVNNSDETGQAESAQGSIFIYFLLYI